MIREVTMPALSSTMTEGKIVTWKKQEGDAVSRSDILLVVESDKADMDVESFDEGILANILVSDGGSAPVGSVIALIAETEAEVAEAKKRPPSGTAAAPPATVPTPAPAPSAPAPVAAATTPVSSGSNGGRIVASPNARRLAEQLGVDLASITGSGPGGRIVGEDVERAAAGAKAPAPAPAAKPASAPAPLPAAAASGQPVAFSALQQAVNRNMEAALAIPAFRVGYTITTDAFDELHKSVKSKGVTVTTMLVKAVAITLAKHPLLFAAYTESGLRYHSAVNVAVAVAMEEGGLITPVLRAADSKDLYTLAREWKDLVERARLKKLQPEEYTSGNFTLSNLGMFGVDRFDAIVPPGTSAILAIGAAKPTVVVTEAGHIAIQKQMQVNLSGDHRVFYGTDGARFLQDLAKLIEQSPQQLTL
ncbi:dihydrolipoamide acetyltransferase family protein [Gloeobacter violaceus]|uniref:Dihydrolipoamide acetyltransferase component of pyruvate dehydrogenase complex n=1 Tax=Gloeobacter violaceus (strain ATCC 29082 / PCC 7421) TaxID=251221 RepID=Q7NHG8_GLOVI|nr:dihydrolipoamide acetyltransferase family protein [Gloeobacter violaceus]BAC90510.1 dihydrolipoamide S-acetyltransferase [Gloeobacter violaceus PCC 7421]